MYKRSDNDNIQQTNQKRWQNQQEKRPEQVTSQSSEMNLWHWATGETLSPGRPNITTAQTLPGDPDNN